MVPLASGVGRPSPGRFEFDHIPEEELRREVPARRSSLIPTKRVGPCLRAWFMVTGAFLHRPGQCIDRKELHAFPDLGVAAASSKHLAVARGWRANDAAQHVLAQFFPQAIYMVLPAWRQQNKAVA